ncbi:MAG: bifunctional 5,10-methylenetetrahydrofolate dehydrogenase/5,10-methenyltetrahydrofolate cyclohydrolase [Acidimicrobiia bacterium]|nr:bifunctional 5,10-methylenetetrahydrofolate dehydrogenase/5,10-methenyltetrahydrofolate cyclohydrolase [Acidimicrobiia bacterium]MBT8249732.1 bifunctional 5,10-methylenetetrahydrofolate dehydrogenase/5,10-methenyltetrahydrofolate cyclohydrolase [Acidimicrobiia bacterium]NNC44077.1 bifunctional 5,10-methylenetetrahydrofolate dehydrogenase/5,10-methenyltetrahydrofolate cyclohydrolase [Acidimicrobiia bacterium]NND13417.1 bifunctional 5,10-methylenetetrahydrofolate dehydrogenase/5,10-methenyltetr
MTIIDGKAVAALVREQVAERVAALGEQGKRVGLATLLVGEDEASQVYVRSKHRAAAEVGMYSYDVEMNADVSQDDVVGQIESLNVDSNIDGMIVQLPLPGALDGNAAVEAIDPKKDADGLHPYNLGLVMLERPLAIPATPYGIMRLLEHYEIETEGKTAVVVGRSFLVGRPLGILLGSKGVDCTVIQAHSRTKNMAELTASADIVVAAVGRPEFITKDMVKPGATVIDVGINRTAEGLVGDVAYDEVSEVAGAITPVPGGVGPMTVASLLVNTVTLAESRST